MKVLIVDGHPASAEYLRQGLSRNGFNVDVASNSIEAKALALGAQEYCLVVLEIDLPGMDGRAFLASLRALGNTPVIVVTRSDSLEDQVYCLRNGADDYLVKPVRLPEFLARASLRMRSDLPAATDRQRLTLGDLIMDLSKRRVERAGLRLDLTRQEFVLLMMLLQRQGSVVSRQDLVGQVWKLPPGAATNVVDVAIRRLRSKLDDPFEGRLLHTIRGLGYVLELR